jgi:hypothetical protein
MSWPKEHHGTLLLDKIVTKLTSHGRVNAMLHHFLDETMADPTIHGTRAYVPNVSLNGIVIHNGGWESTLRSFLIA